MRGETWKNHSPTSKLSGGFIQTIKISSNRRIRRSLQNMIFHPNVKETHSWPLLSLQITGKQHARARDSSPYFSRRFFTPITSIPCENETQITTVLPNLRTSSPRHFLHSSLSSSTARCPHRPRPRSPRPPSTARRMGGEKERNGRRERQRMRVKSDLNRKYFRVLTI